MRSGSAPGWQATAAPAAGTRVARPFLAGPRPSALVGGRGTAPATPSPPTGGLVVLVPDRDHVVVEHTEVDHVGVLLRVHDARNAHQARSGL